MRSQYACPNNNIYAISNAINRNCKLFGFVLIFFGYYMTFLSYKYSDLTQILIGVLFITYLSVYVVLNQFNTEIFYDEKELFTWLIISFLIGLGTGFLFTNSFVICSATVGGFTGYFLTQILMQSVVVSVTRQANLFFWVIFAILFSFCVYFGVKFQKHFFIIYSCFIGSYGIVRVNLIFNINCLFQGLGALDNNFPDEQQIYALTNHGEIYQIQKLIDYRYYLYVSTTFILAIAGICFQYKNYFKDMKSNE